MADLLVSTGRGAEARGHLPAVETLARVAGANNKYATETLNAIRTRLQAAP